MMDSFAIEAAEGFVNVGYPLDAQALLLCELDGTKAQVQAELESELLQWQNCPSSLTPQE
jgi:glycolate oxidase